MHGIGHQLFSCPAFPDNQHRGIGRRDRLDLLQHRTHFRVASENAAETEPVLQHLFQLLILLAERDHRSRAFDDQEQLVHLKGLGNVIVCAQLDGADGGFDRPVGRDQNHFRLRSRSLHAFKIVSPSAPGRRKSVITMSNSRRGAFQPFCAGCRREDFVTDPFQSIQHGQSHQRFIIDNEYLEGPHETLSNGCRSGETGNQSVNTVPFPTSLSTRILPPCRSTIPRLTDKPSPVPSPSFFVVKNGSKIRGKTAAGIPHPES